MKFIKKMIVFSLILLFATGCSSDSAANKDALEKTDGKDEIVLDENDIKSTGPNGEKAAPASSLTLTDEEIAKLKAGNYSAAISFHYAGNDWSSAQQKGLEDTFKKLGINIVGTTDANFSVEQQVSDLETLTALNPDVMISIPTDAKATSDAFKRVSSRGIKLVFMDNVPDNFVAGENYVGAVSADNYGNGVIAAELIGDKLKGKGKIGIVNYDVDYFVTNQRLEAFEKTIKKKYPDIEVIAKSGFSDVNQSTEVADAMLTQNPDIEAIFAIWDIPAEGVLSALTSAGREDVFVSTIDLGDNIAKEIAQGKVLGVGAQLPYDQGVAEATMAAYALLGKETPSYVAVPATKVERNTIVSGYEMVYHKKAPGFITEELDK
ncbi:substrate-binding domain-containing protein [Candidatus Enterococcus murrayae]|uniref:Substrate-binding domain-containing protein n=1 Tax=Candidatus Enterococcus murrayae TaxID=2815321 RepID=A0ABS3HBZ6_9ENTE|nr:substrate-binding domain-containing protein [Enterococcus sp. MJM16]MBO0450981.1 substrate-binding domain-containing protein [Enterococcus sp. MJM16]